MEPEISSTTMSAISLAERTAPLIDDCSTVVSQIESATFDVFEPLDLSMAHSPTTMMMTHHHHNQHLDSDDPTAFDMSSGHANTMWREHLLRRRDVVAIVRRQHELVEVAIVRDGRLGRYRPGMHRRSERVDILTPLCVTHDPQRWLTRARARASQTMDRTTIQWCGKNSSGRGR